MTKNQSVRNVGRSFISLLLAYWCVIMPMTGPARAFSFSSNAGDGQPNALRREAGKSPDARGIQFKSLPLRFELNAGQTDPQVRFIARSQGGDVFLTPREMVLCVRETPPSQVKNSGLWPQSAKPTQAESNRAVIRLQTVNANPAPRITGLDPLPGKTNYFIGNDPKNWRTNIPSYARVKYENIYPGIDLIYYDNQGNIEYDFNVAPGADPSRIRLAVEGADGVRIDEAGDLVMRTAIGDIRQHAPRIYQKDGNNRREIAGGYVFRQDGRVAFDLARYDPAKPLVIDPEVVFATYFGGSSETVIAAIAVDASGSLYVAGATFSHDFPTKNPLQSTNNHSQSLSAIITKFSPDGASLVYSTYLGGSTNFASDTAIGLALDSTGAAYVTGDTNSRDFPTRNPIQGAPAAGSADLFVSKISADGASLLYSTYLGGSSFDFPRGIVLDSSNSAYVFGYTLSTDFPTVRPTQATFNDLVHEDGFISVISADGSQLLFSTCVGGNDDDDVQQLVVFSETGDIWITGQTQSSNFAGNSTGSPGPYQAYYRRTGAGSYEQPLSRYLSSIIPTPCVSGSTCGTAGLRCPADVSKSSPGVSTFSTTASSSDIKLFLYGGCAIVAPATTCSGNASIIAEDASTLTFKSAVNIADPLPPIAKDVVRDSQDTIYVTGPASRTDVFPLVNPIQSVAGGRTDVYVMVFAPSTRQIIFSTYLGGSDNDEVQGIALDPQGNIYIAGKTSSPNFPTKNAFQATPPGPGGVMQGQGNSFIVKLSAIAPVQAGPDFTLGFDSPTVTSPAGVKAKITININRAGGFTGNVTVTPAFPGQGVKPKPADAITTTDSSVTFKYKTAAAVAGQYPLTFTGKDDSGKTRTATVTLILQ